MRARVVQELGDLTYPRFLVYLMGPYTAFDLEHISAQRGETETQPDVGSIPESVDFGTLVGSDVALESDEAVLDLLVDVRDRLRVDPGVNAFLAIDIDIPLAEMDAATQSIEFALASNAAIYIVPSVGDNLGVGIEVGAVLEAIFRGQETTRQELRHNERVLFVHESGVRSAMIASVRERWDARVYAYEDRADLVDQVRLCIRDLARCEQHGDLPTME